MFTVLMQQPAYFVVWLFAILIALSLHEFSHAAMSSYLGDHTAKRLGRLTVNPLAHVDPMGFLMLILVGFGWGKPVPFNPYNLRNQKWGPVAIALAGPGMNVALALVFGLTFRIFFPILGESNLLIQFLLVSVTLNLSLFVFNLIPIPPLDGSKLLLAFLSGPAAVRTRAWLETRGSMLLIGLIIADTFLHLGVFSVLLSPILFMQGWILGV